MIARGGWCSHPEDWQPRLEGWRALRRRGVRFHSFAQRGGRKVQGVTLGEDSGERPVRLLVAVPHAHEPAPTAAIVELAGALLGQERPDASSPGPCWQEVRKRLLLTLLPDTNSQGRTRSPRAVWDGQVDNESFLKIAFGETGDGARFGRFPEWRWDEHRPRRVGIVYEEVEPGLWVEPNTSRRSTHTRAMDALFEQYRYTHYLDMHQHEGYEAALLPADFDDLPLDARRVLEQWANAVLSGWEEAGIRHKGSYIPYRGQPRQQFFREYWAGRCPGMLKLTTETRNNRHSETGEPTSAHHQRKSAWRALESTLTFLVGG
ncbi:MAG: hypothetical protein FJX77_10640 [Armatimonadetes bacterium]|nr:hypothetical protein [Armatimonadota bacterium]